MTGRSEQPDATLDEIYSTIQRSPKSEWPKLVERHAGNDPAIAATLSALLGLTPAENDPERVAHFRILGRLGRGGMGVVYKAEDEKLRRIVALKVQWDNAEGPERKRRFLREARSAASVAHANVAAVYEVDEAEGRAYIAMELVEGERLRDWLRRGPIDVDAARGLALQIARGLAAAHDKGIVHRDLKPENVMITSSGVVKLLDFGLAKATRTAEDVAAETLVTTHTGRILGTLEYMSPEQAMGKPVDARSDVFSFGVLLYEMLCGKRPFAGDSDAELVASILRDAAPLLTESGAQVDAVTDALVRKCLEKIPPDRFANAGEILEALSGTSPSHSRPGTTAPITPKTDDPAFRLSIAEWPSAAPTERVQRAGDSMAQPAASESQPAQRRRWRKAMPVAIASVIGFALVVGGLATRVPRAACSVGTYSCDGQQPQACNGSGAWQNVGSPCSGTTPACVKGGCMPCTPTSVGCYGTQPRTCDSTGTWHASGSACDGTTPYCANGMCTAVPPSCAPGGAGMSNCGAPSESCCTSLEVAGGTYYRSYNRAPDGGLTTAADGGATWLADPATVSGFRLDKYEVTVGRFRQFVGAWKGGSGYVPPAGSGKHAHLNGGRGLANSGAPGTYETGWVAADDSNIELTNTKLGPAPEATWTNSEGTQENLPINFVNWYEAYAFCIWDGGFLPSESEWEYAAAGGSQQRKYPWGATPPGTGSQYAIYGDLYVSGGPWVPGANVAVSNIARVGTATQGAGVWGQLDLSGNVNEWNLDEFVHYVEPCADCAYLSRGGQRVVKGGDYGLAESYLLPRSRLGNPPTTRNGVIGFRCARIPAGGT